MEESGSGSGGGAWMESLRARQQELDSRKSRLAENWRNAECASSIPLALPDWVRRLDVGDYPLVACGSASGNIFVANLETGDLLAQTDLDNDDNDTPEPLDGLEPLIDMLFSGFDGGGTLAIAIKGGLVCSAGRQGSVQVWRIDDANPRLVSQGSMAALEGQAVTCLELDDEYLWVATADGDLHAYPYRSKDMPLTLQHEPALSWKLDGAILSMSLSSELGYGTVTTANRQVYVFSLDDDDEEALIEWTPEPDPLGSGDDDHILSASLVAFPNEEGCVVVCGSRDGAMRIQPLNWQNGMVDEEDPLMKSSSSSSTVYQPRHNGPLKCLASPAPGLLISAGQDGSIRLWNVSKDKTFYMYQFMGYKVWLGSVWTDGTRLVSDGADNTIVVHDYSRTNSESTEL